MEERKCSKCGNILNENEMFCSKCGTKYEEVKVEETATEVKTEAATEVKTEIATEVVKKNFCSKCGAELNEGIKFCSKCGNPVGATINNVSNNGATKKSFNPLFVVIPVVVVAIILLFGGCALVISATQSVDDLVEKGKYEAAYKKADNDDEYDLIYEAMLKDKKYSEIYELFGDKKKEQLEIDMLEEGLYEKAYDIIGDSNIVLVNELAYYSKEIDNNLKDKSSFVLRDVYYDKDKKRILFEVNGNNSYGGSVMGYWLYEWDDDDNKYTLYTYLSSLDSEDYYSYDTYAEKLEKLYKNLIRIYIKNTMFNNDDMLLDSSLTNTINALFNNGLLDDVEYPDYAPVATAGKENESV